MNGVSTVAISSEGDDKLKTTRRRLITVMTSRILPPHDVTGKVAGRTVMSMGVDHQKRAGAGKFTFALIRNSTKNPWDNMGYPLLSPGPLLDS